METKIDEYKTKLLEHANRLRDVRAVGLVMFGFIVLLMSWSGVKTIETNYTLQKQIAELQQKNDVQRLSNTNLKLGNEYYQTDQYLEITARQNFGLAAPGEAVFVVPKDVALKHTVEMPDVEAAKKKETEAKRPAYQRNFQAWMDFLLHRQER